MPQDEPSKISEEKSIAEIEAEIHKMHEKVVKQTADVKKVIKKKTITSPLNIQNIADNATNYTLEETQAEFFAVIATFNSVISNYEEGRLNPQLYEQQYKLLLQEISKFKLILEQKNSNPNEFIIKENIPKKFQAAYRSLRHEGIFKE